MLPAGVTPDNVAAARRHAEAYADAHGFGLGADDFSVIQSRNPDQAFIGVEFDITVGKAVIDADQRMPGVLDSWTWSGRVDFWRRMFGRFDGGRQGRILARREDGLASITSISRNPFDQLRAKQERGHGQAPPS